MILLTSRICLIALCADDALYPLTNATQGADVIGENNPVILDQITWTDGPTGNVTHVWSLSGY